MRFLLAVLPAAACSAAMFLCFRMMRHSDMPAGRHAESDDVHNLRKEVGDLREELARVRSAPPGKASDGVPEIGERRPSDVASDPRTVSPATPSRVTSATGHPDG